MIDVVIAGGGPNGLMLACELALAGVRPVVLEQRPAGEITENRANGVIGRVVPILDRRGQEVTGLAQDEKSVTIGIAGTSRPRRPSWSAPTAAAARSARSPVSASRLWPGTMRFGSGGG